jgi:hypothetical protein
MSEAVTSTEPRKRGGQAGAKRGPYKARTAPRKVETKPRKRQDRVVHALEDFYPELLRALNLAITSDNLILPRLSFYRLEQIKARWGAPAVKLFKQFFHSKQDGYDRERAERIEQRFREGDVNDPKRKIGRNKLLMRCVEWRWRLRINKLILARELVQSQLNSPCKWQLL